MAGRSAYRQLPAVRQALGLPVHQSTVSFQPHVWQLCRFISVHTGENDCLAAFHQGALVPRVCPFQVSLQQAQEAFEAWQQSHWLAPGRLLRKGLGGMHSALLPFWIFEATVKVDYSGSVGFPVNNRSMIWREVPWTNGGFREYPWTLSSMKVYASYRYRRDLADAAKIAGVFGRSRALKREEAESQLAVGVGWGEKTQDDVELDPPSMRQAIGWSFALRNIRRLEAEEAEQALLKSTGAESVRDVKIRLKTLRRRARLLFLPAYVADYKFGESFNAHGERRPQRFQAVVSGMDPSSIAAERHYSPHKVQAAAAGAMGLLGLAAGAIGFYGVAPAQLLTVTSAFSVFMVCSAAGLAVRMSTPMRQERQERAHGYPDISWGLAARMSTQMRREREEQRRLLQEEADFERIMSLNLGPMNSLDDDQEEARCAGEWKRWQEADKWAWDETKRQHWADTLWRNQQKRRLGHEALRRNIAAAEAKQRLEAEAEARRRQRWGESTQQRSWNAQHDSQLGGAGYGRGRKDFLGYYAMLGLDAEAGLVSQGDVKRAFREAALRWHPDKQKETDAVGKQKAQERFQRLKTAYEVLKDPQTRKDYDSGRMAASG